MTRWCVLMAGILLLPVAAGAGEAGRHAGYGEDACIRCHPGLAGGAGPDKDATHAGLGCPVCHDFHEPSGNLSFVRSPLTAPDGVTLPVIFTARSGPGSFDDGDAVHDGICEVCHTATAYHRRDGGGLPHHDGQDCTVCHPHEEGFQPMGGTCLECHARPQPPLAGYRRQIVQRDGDGGGDFTQRSHHVTDGTTTQVVTDADCLVCHDQSRHRSFTDGVEVLLRDPAGGPSLLYDGTAASLDAFCLGCHDGTHPAPFSDGRPAADHSGYDYRRHGGRHCTECHGNGHGSPNLALIATIVSTPYGALRPVTFTALTGPGSFADGDTVRDGICEVCHTTTWYHREDGTGTPHHEGTDCRACHRHDSGFHPVTGSCLVCHTTLELAGMGLTTGVDDGPPAAPAVRCYPCPATGGATIVVEGLGKSAASPPAVEIYDLRGRRVRRLPVGPDGPGRAAARWDGRDETGRPVESGTYLVRVPVSGAATAAKLQVVH